MSAHASKAIVLAAAKLLELESGLEQPALRKLCAELVHVGPVGAEDWDADGRGVDHLDNPYQAQSSSQGHKAFESTMNATSRCFAGRHGDTPTLWLAEAQAEAAADYVGCPPSPLPPILPSPILPSPQ